MANADWIKVRSEYEATNTSYRKLAAKHDVSFDTLQRRAKREDLVKCKKETCDKITTKIRQKTVVKTVDRNSKILSIADRLADKIESTV